MKYYVFVDYGTHRVKVEVSESDFFKVVDDFSFEFEIFKYHMGHGVIGYAFRNYHAQPFTFACRTFRGVES